MGNGLEEREGKEEGMEKKKKEGEEEGRREKRGRMGGKGRERCRFYALLYKMGVDFCLTLKVN